MITLNEILDDILSLERKPEAAKVSFFERIHNFNKRRDIEKQIQDEIDLDNQKVLQSGVDSEEFLHSKYYANLIEPYVRTSVKNSLQKIISTGETMSESELKYEVAKIKETLKLVASIQLKVVLVKQLKDARHI